MKDQKPFKRKLTIDDKIKVMADSDAKFDGYHDGLVHLSKVNRDRYIKRAERSFYALQKLIWENFGRNENWPRLDDLRMTSDENMTSTVKIKERNV